MKNKFRIKLLITCLFALVLSLSLFAFACNNDANDTEDTLSATPFASQTSNDPANAEGLKHIYDYIPEYKTYEGITVDGVVGEEEWAGKNKISYTFVQAGQTYTIELSTDFNKDGFVMYTKVSGGPIYYNYGRGSTLNTGIEYYVASSGSGHTGIDINHRTWEIDLTAGGYFLTKIRNCPGARDNEAWRIYVVPLDVDITLLGTLNDPNSTEGFVFEWFMPWYALGDSTPPTSIYVLPAYLYAASKTSTASVWVDTIKEGLGRSGAWGTYSKRLEFTENGYKDPNDKTLPVNIMNETPEFGTVTYTGTKESGATVTAVPNEGYEVESFVVNGKTVTGMSTTLLPNSFTGLSVMVKFKKASTTRPKLNFTVNFTATGAPMNYSIEGKKVRLSTTYAEQVATITNNKATFNLPAGNYTVSMEDLPLLSCRATVTSSTTTLTANMKIDAFTKNTTVSSLTTDDNGTDIYFVQGAGQQHVEVNTDLGKVVWLQAKIGKIFETSIAQTGGTYISTNGLSWGTVWDSTFEHDGWRLRFAGDYWTTYQMTDAEYTAFCNNTLEIAVSLGNGFMYGFARANSSSAWRLVGYKTTSGATITGIATNHQSATSNALDVQYAIESITDTGLIDVTTTVTTGSETGSATAGIANYGGTLIIKQSPKEGYKISSITIDGVSYNYYLIYNLPTAESDVVITGVPAKYSYNVEVGFVATTATDTITINVQTIKSVNGSSTKEKYVGKLTFINSDDLRRTYTLSSGLIKTDLLEPGTYRVVPSDSNYQSQIVTISPNQTSYDLLMSYKTLLYTVSAYNGGYSSSVIAGTYNTDRSAEGIVYSNNGTSYTNTLMYFNPDLGEIKYAVATIKLKPSKLDGLDVFGGFYTGGTFSKSPVGVEYSGDGPAGFVLRYVSNGVDGNTSNQFQIRSVSSIGWSSKTMKTVTSASDLEYTITIAMYLDGSYARLYYKTTGALTFWASKACTDTRIESLNFYNNACVEVTNLMLYTTPPAARPVTVTYTGVTDKATATVQTSAVAGTVVPIKITVQDGYTVNSITMNGSVLSFTKSGNVYSAEFTASTIGGTNAISVAVSATNELREVGFTLKNSDNILMDTYVPKNLTVKITGTNTGNTTSYSTSVLNLGVIKATLPDGTYKAEVTGYNSFTFTVDGSGFSKAVTLSPTKVVDDATFDSTGKLEESAFTADYTISSNFASKLVYVEFTHYYPSNAPTAETGGVFVRLSSTTENAAVTWGTHYDPSKYYAETGNWGVRFGGLNLWNFGAGLGTAQYNKFKSSTGFKIGVAIVNNKAYGLIEDNDGEGMRVMCRLGTYSMTGITSFYRNKVSKISDVKMATRIEDCPDIVKQLAGQSTMEVSNYINASNFTLTNATSSSGYTITSDVTKTQKYSQSVPYAMSKTGKISFKFNYSVAYKIFPAIVLHGGAGVKSDASTTSFQFCCWTGNWSLQTAYGDNAFTSCAGSAALFKDKTSVSVEIKANASGYLAMYIDGTEFATTTPVSKIVAYEFWYNVDGTYGYMNNNASSGTKATYSFSNFIATP